MEFTQRQDAETFLNCMVHAFEFHMLRLRLSHLPNCYEAIAEGRIGDLFRIEIEQCRIRVLVYAFASPWGVDTDQTVDSCYSALRSTRKTK